MNRAFNYFLNQTPGLGIENLKVYFDFESGINLNYIRNKSGNASLSGELLNVGGIGSQENFYLESGAGFFNSGNYLKINGLTGINLKNSTFCFIYENLRKGGSTLLSNIETGEAFTFDEFGLPSSNVIYKGFEFGVTANNQLYFEYYSPNGPNIFTSDFFLSDKNSIFLSLNDNNITYGYYNFYQNSLVSKNFSIESDFLFDMDKLHIGYNPLSSGLFNFNQIFTGYISEFLIFSPTIYNYDIISVNSGYSSNYREGEQILITTVLTGITGFSNQITGYQIEITGTILIETGVIIDEWGVEYLGYDEIELTGLIPQFGLTGLTGIISSFTEEFFSGEGAVQNINFLNSLGKKNINFLSKINGDDVIEACLNSTIENKNSLLKNINLTYDKSANIFYKPAGIIFVDQPVVFVNGQLHVSGNFVTTGTPYNPGRFLLNDYFLNRGAGEFLFKNNYNQDNNIFIDLVSGNSLNLFIDNFTVSSGSGFLTLTGWNDNLNNIYFNGQKLISGIHYNVDATTYDIVFDRSEPLFGGSDGKLVAISKNYDFYIKDTNKNLITSNNKYLYNLSEIYKNGLRQKLNEDYLELASIDINTGKGFFDVKTDFIYNNENGILI